MTVPTLETLTAGSLVPVAGGRTAAIPPELAERYRPGDQIIVLQDSSELELIPAQEHAIAASAVNRAVDAFKAMSRVPDDSIARFFSIFAARLADESCWASVAAANATDVEMARANRRSTTRLVATSPSVFGVGRMWEGYTEFSDDPSHIQVFYDLPSALKWIGLESMPS